MGKHRSRSRLRAENQDSGDGSSSGVPVSNRFATLPADGSQPPTQKVKRRRSRKKSSLVDQVGSNRKKNRGPSDGASGSIPEMDENCDEATGGPVANNDTVQSTVKVKLPPLVVKNAHLNHLIADMASLGVKAEYKLGRVGTKVVLHTRVDYDVAVTHLRESKVEFFTHDIPSEKPFKVIIRGLPNFDPKSIEAEIKDRYKLNPIGIFRITRRDENVKTYPDCLFLVHFPKGTVTLNALQAIRSIHSIIVRWESYRGGHRDVTQCQRCLNFGHGTRNCNIKPRCGKCAQDHATTDCTAEESVASKCANCGGSHQGSDKQCPKREEFKRLRKQESSNNRTGQRKDRTPVLRPEDFPPLRAPEQGQTNAWIRPTLPKDTSSTDAGLNSPSPPGFWRPSTQNGNPDLFSADELMEIFVNMTGALRKCRSKPEQLQVLGKFIIQYGV